MFYLLFLENSSKMWYIYWANTQGNVLTKGAHNSQSWVSQVQKKFRLTNMHIRKTLDFSMLLFPSFLSSLPFFSLTFVHWLLCVWVLCMSCVPHASLVLLDSRRVGWILSNWNYRWLCELPVRCWGSNPGPLEEASYLQSHLSSPFPCCLRPSSHATQDGLQPAL